MTTAENSPPPAAHAAPATFWLPLLKGVAATLLLLVMLLLSLLLGLQSNTGLHLLTRSLAHWLSTPDSQVEIGTVHGQIPWDMTIDRLTWADREGIWLSVETARLHWSLTDGWRAQLKIYEVGAKQLHLYRQPHTNPTPPLDSKPILSSLPFGLAYLPTLLVERLQIEELILDAAAYGQAARFVLEGEIKHLSAPNPTAAHPLSDPTQLLAKLQVRPLDAGDTQLNLQATLSPAGSLQSDSQLTFTLDGHEQSGLLAALTGLPAAKGIDFKLAGQGPLATWQGTLAVTLDGMGAVHSQVDFQYADPPVLRMRGQVQGDTALLGPARTALFAPAKPTLDLALQAEWLKTQEIHLSHLTIGTPFAHLNLQGTLALPTQQLTGAAELTIAQLATLAPVTGTPLAGALTATLTTQGHWQQPHLKLTAQATDLAMATWQAKQLDLQWEEPEREESSHRDQLFRGHGTLVGLRSAADLLLGTKPLAWSAQVTRPASGSAQLTRLELTNQTITALMEGKVALGEASGQGRWQITVPHIEAWIKQAAPDQTIQGKGQWSGLFTLNPPTSEKKQQDNPLLTTTLTGEVSALQGLPIALQPLLGSQVQMGGKLALWAGEKLELTDLDLRADSMVWQGAVAANLATQHLTGHIQTQIPQLAPFSTLAGLPLKGSLQVETQLDGPLWTPRLRADFTTPALSMGTVQWENPHLLVTLDRLASPLHGTLKLDLQNLGKQRGIAGQPLSATSFYRLEEPVLQLADLRVVWPTGKVMGEKLRIDLVQRVVEGELTGQSISPGPLVQWLAGEDNPLPPTLEGALALQVQLIKHADKQGVQAVLNAQQIRDAKPTLNGFDRLEQATLNVTLADLWGKPNGTLVGSVSKLRWGSRQIHTTQWQMAGTQTAATVTMSSTGLLATPEQEGEFSLALSKKQRSAVARVIPEAFEIQANGNVGRDNNGVIRGTLAGLTGQIGSDAVRLAEAAHIILTPNGTKAGVGSRLDLDRLQLHYGPARLDGHLHYDAERLDIEGTLHLPLPLLSRLGGPDLQGQAQAHIRLTGGSRQPIGEMTLQLEQVHINDPALESIPPATLQVSARLERGQVNANVLLEKLTSKPITALLLFPVRLGFAPFHFSLPAQGKVDGTLNADAQLTQFALMAVPGLMDTQKVDGQLNIALHVGGTVATPTVEGEIMVRNGSYENGYLGTQLKEIQLNATAHGQTIVMDKLTANDGGQGHLYATGTLSLDVEQGFPFKLDTTLEKGLVVGRDEVQATVSGRITAQGDKNRVVVTGDLTGNEVLLYLAETPSVDMQSVPIDTEIRNGLNVLQAESAQVAPPTSVSLDIALHLPNRVYLRGRGLESEWQGDLTIHGMANAPQIDGQMGVRRGYFEFMDKRFDLRKGIIAFDGATPPQPNLELEAVSKPTNNLVALLSLQGPAFSPTLRLSSEPEVPQDEILAHLLFDRNRQQLTPAQAIGLAMAIEKLHNGGPGLLGRARDTIGVDRLELGGESVESGSVKAGKYLNENIFVGVERGLKQGSGKVSVELELTPNITLETEMDEENKNGVGINWKYDY